MTISMCALIGLVIFMLGVWLGTRIADSQAKPHLKKAYELGIKRGYEFRKMMDGVEKRNRGIILGGLPDIEIDQILKGKGVN